MIELRPTTWENVAGLAAMHVQAWREAYPGMVPDSTLASLGTDERTAMWRDTLTCGTTVVLALDPEGIAACGPQRDASLPFAGEIYGLYLLLRAQRQGIGRTLMRYTAKDLLHRGFGAVSLWVLEDNARARAFYPSLGGREATRKSKLRDDWIMHEVAHGWDDARDLLSWNRASATP